MCIFDGPNPYTRPRGRPARNSRSGWSQRAIGPALASEDPLSAVPSELRPALERRGFSALTPVQVAVLRPAFAGRDLRISSETGSGKTVAVGFTLAPLLEREDEATGCQPRAILIVPTRELAAQVRGELAWLFHDVKKKIVVVTGGTSTRDERRTLSRGADVVVGTPGRLLDHLERGAIDASQVKAVVLDEADQMFDLGFREELEAILGKLPTQRTTHLVSATFPREVMALGERYQENPVAVEGTRLGVANANIEHLVHIVRQDQRLDALVNLLLAEPDERTLIFVRTRADTAELSRLLVEIGFHVGALSGDMEQEDRTRTLSAFRSGMLRVLVATDVAARGIDVPDIGRVIHADPPSDPDMYTHRSGRTGRAGQRGESILLCPPGMRARVQNLVRRAKVEPKVLPVPDAKEIERRADRRLLDALSESSDEIPERVANLTRDLLAALTPDALVSRLLLRLHHYGPATARAVARVEPAVQLERQQRPHDRPRDFVPFRINWGQRQGADARRLLALVCRRGGIRGSEVGAIEIGPLASTFEVATRVAAEFALAARKPDARDPRVQIEPFDPKRAQRPGPKRDAGPPRGPKKRFQRR
jgi:ATP-dependent RNA helicase DeaD